MLGKRHKLKHRQRLNLTPDFHLNLTTQSIKITPVAQFNHETDGKSNISSPHPGKAVRTKRYHKMLSLLISLSILGLVCGFSGFWTVSMLRPDPLPETPSGKQ